MWKTWSSGIDWITATALKDEKGYTKLTEFGLEAIREAKAEGHKEERVKILDFVGMKVPGCRLVYRKTGMMLQLSGELAHRKTLQLRSDAGGFRVKRLDFEITAQADSRQREWERRLYKQWSALRAQSGMDEAVCHSFIERGRRGATFMVGSRNSAQFARFYNKTAEQKGRIAPNLHRAEVQYNGELAAKMFDALGDTASPMQFAADCVRAFCTQKRIQADWIGGECLMRMPTTYTPTDAERQLKWLRDFVRPTVLKLIDIYGYGPVLDALGFADVSRNNHEVRKNIRRNLDDPTAENIGLSQLL
jgi:hypothetical protein